MQLKWDEAKKIINQGNVFLTFKTSWCPDCKMMAMLLEPLLKDLKEQGIAFNEVEVDAEEAQLFREASDWKVLKVPSFYLLQNGVAEHIGYEFVPLEVIKEKIITKFKQR